jgi:hypothetical protein
MKIKKIFLSAIFIIALMGSQSFAQEKAEYTIGETRIVLLKSLILPGWGEHSLGYHKRGLAFNTAELVGWLGYAAFTLYSGQTRDDMKAFASDHAGINPAGKDNQYFTDIGNYMNIHDYNEQKRRYRQIEYIYDEERMFWAWDSKENKQEFDDMRLNSRLAKRNASLVVSALVLNRLISVIDIATITKGKVENPFDDDLDAMFYPEREKVTLSLNYRF